jgi:hypothetical protein
MPSAASGVHLLLLDDEGVLFDEFRQEVLALNTAATTIWCLMDQGGTTTEIDSRLQAMFGLDAEQAASFTAAALGDWAARGLLEGTPRPPPAAPDEPRVAALPPYPEPVPGFVRERHYVVRELPLTVRFTEQAQEALVHPVLAHLEASPSASACRIDIVTTQAGITLYRDGAARLGCTRLDELVPLAKGLAWQFGLSNGDFLLNMHAGVVAGPAGAILLPAPPGSGKSTLTAALVAAGLDYFSDEVALLTEDTLAVMPFPLAMCVKDTGIDVLAALFPEITTLPMHIRPDAKRVVYMPPPAERVPRHDTRRPVVAIVFPRYAAGEPNSLRTLAKPAALARLLSQCTGVGALLETRHVARLVAWISDLRCYEMDFSDLGAAVADLITIATGGSEAPARRGGGA